MPIDDIQELSQLLTNTSTKKRPKDLVEISEIFWKAKERYGSTEILAQKLSLSREMVREFLLVKRLPLEVKELLKTRKIDSIDAIKEISSLKTDAEKIDFAKAIIDLDSSEIRDLKQLVKFAKIPIIDAKSIILKSRLSKGHYVVIFLEDSNYQYVKTMSVEKGVSITELIEDMVRLKRQEEK